MTTLTPLSTRLMSKNSVVQFGKSDNRGIDQLRETLRNNGDGEVILKSRTEAAPPTKMNQAKKKFFRGLAALGILAASVAGGVTGWKTGGNYQQEKRDLVPVVALHNKIYTDWDALADSAYSAEQLGNLNDQNARADYNNKMAGFLNELIQTMRENPGQLDQTIVKLLESNTDFAPQLHAIDLAPSFTRFMEQELQSRFNVTPTNAGKQQIEQIDILNDFIEPLSEFDTLSDSEKEQLETQLKADYWEHHTFVQPSYFTDTLRGALDKGIVGATLEEFTSYTEGKSLATEQDAIELFENIVRNNDNFSKLTSEQREGIITRGTEILGSLEYKSPNVMRMVLAGLLTVGALGGLGYTAVKRRKELAELFTQVPANVWAGLKHPVLIVNMADKSPEAQNALDIIVADIQSDARSISQLIQQAYDQDPQIKVILDKEYQGQLPDEHKVLAQFAFDVYQAIVAKQSRADRLQETPIEEFAFLQQLQDKLNEALTSGEILRVVLPKGMLNTERPTVNTTASDLEKLQIGKRQIEYDLREARRILSNRVLGHMQAKIELTQATEKLDQAEALLIQLDDQKASDDQKTVVVNQIRELEDQIKRLTNNEERFNLLMLKAKLVMVDRIKTLTEFSAEIDEARAKNAYANAVNEILTLSEEAKSMAEDSELKEIIEKMELDALIKQERLNLETMDKELDAKIEALTQQKLATAKQGQ